MKSLLFFILALTCCFVQAQHNWVMQKNQNDIMIFTKTDTVTGIAQIKADILFKSPIEKIAKELMDVSKYKEWIYNCIASDIISKPNDSVVTYKHITDLPWPFQDRDQIAKFSLTRNTVNKSISISSQLQQQYPEYDYCQRIKKSAAVWILTPQKDGTVKAYYTLSFDPGGNIPSWLVNLFVVDGPYYSFMALKKRLNEN